MSFAKVHSAQVNFLEPHIVDIEVDLSKGLHSFTIVGLPDKAVEESRDRMSSAIKNSGFKSPKAKNQKVVISLAPADIKKEGPHFDLPIALSYLLSSEEIKFEPKGKIFLGELSLDGSVRKISGVLPLTQKARDAGFSEIYVPIENAKEAALIENITVYGVPDLRSVILHLNLDQNANTNKLIPTEKTLIEERTGEAAFDFSDVKGQETAKRGLEIAAAGGHNIALLGPAGTGKTMLARAFSSILPNLSYDEVLEVTSIHSVAGTLRESYLTISPFRSPHHTSSYVSLVGGGATPKPGEVTLAHRGILFMDEFPEFDRKVIEVLRQPLEDKVVTISRSKGTGHFPANFILVAAMNPCPCGNYGTTKECTCMPRDLIRYKKKMSGPIADRIDMWIDVPLLSHKKLSDTERTGEMSESIQKRVASARTIQKERFTKVAKKIKLNSEMGPKEIQALVPLKEETKNILNTSAERLKLSARAYHKVIKLARTIADLEKSENVETGHILEALQYRPKEN
jgi:magnesium chelatase family protein